MATTLDDIKALRQHFVDGWPSSVPFTFDNEPAQDPPIDSGANIWARFSVIPNDTKTIGFGKRVREYGRVYLHVFSPRNLGVAPGQALVDAFKANFHQITIDNYRVRLLECVSGADDSDPKFYTISATVQYQADH